MALVREDVLLLDSPEFQAMVVGYQQLVVPAMITFTHPSSVDKLGLALVAAYEYRHKGPRRILMAVGRHLNDYARWMLEDFGLYHFERFREHEAVQQWQAEHRETIDVLSVPSPGASKFRRLLALAMIPWNTPEAYVAYKSDDSMLPAGTVVKVFRAHLPSVRSGCNTSSAEFDVFRKWSKFCGSVPSVGPAMDYVVRKDYRDAMMRYVSSLSA